MIRNAAAIAGVANASPSSLRNTEPTSTAGMVASTTSQNNRRSSGRPRAGEADERQAETEPVAPEEGEERDRRAEMHDGEIGEPVRGREVDAPVQETRQDHRMAEAADRKQLRHALQHGHDDRLDGGH